MTVPLRVLHVVPHLDRVGGAERQALTLARLQHRRSAMAPILLTHGAEGLPEFEKGAAGEIHRLPGGLRRHHPGRWWRRHGGRIDLVHAHGLHKLTGQVVSLARDAGIPTLVKVATQGDVRLFAAPGAVCGPLDGDDRPPGGWRWRLGIATAWRRLRRAHLFAALNDGIAAELDEQGLAFVRVANQVDGEHFRPPTPGERQAARAALGLGPDAALVLSLGRLARRKDVSCLIEAFARLVSGGAEERNGAGIQLVVAGDGPLRAALEARSRALGLAEHVRFRGEVADPRPLLHAADVLVNPSHREGQPNAVLEARACDLPTVLSDIEGHRDLGAARLFPPGDAQALAAVLHEVVRGG